MRAKHLPFIRISPAALVLAAWCVTPIAAAEDIVVGMSAAFTGPSRALGIELYCGSSAFFEDLNRSGGVFGRRIVIKPYDDGYNPAPAVDNTIHLIEKDDVFLLFNYVGTPTVARTLPLLKRRSDRSMYLFFPFTGAQPQRQPPYSDFVFNLRASYYQETAGLVDHFVEVGRKQIAVFYQIDAYGRNGWEGVRAALARHGLKMSAEATYRRGASDKTSFKQQVEILRTSGADAVICIGAYGACAGFIRDVRNAGWGVPIANVSFVGSESLLDALQEAGKSSGTDYTHDLVNSQVVPSYLDATLPAVAEYRRLVDKYRPRPPCDLVSGDYTAPLYSYVGLEGFLNAKVLAAILTKMGPPFERSRLRQAAESIRDLDIGIEAPISFGPNRRQAIDRVYFTSVRNGRFETLTDWSRWKK
jgi:ABC-type branched-subunit amino acid transport system substrate-binding protein